MSQPQTESYTAAKGGISALTHALAVSLAGRARVNSISPGWIDTEYRVYQGPDAAQQPVGRVGNPTDIAELALFLCSPRAGFITGENICADGGMTRQMIYHGDCGWRYEEEGTGKMEQATGSSELATEALKPKGLPLWGRWIARSARRMRSRSLPLPPSPLRIAAIRRPAGHPVRR